MGLLPPVASINSVHDSAKEIEPGCDEGRREGEKQNDLIRAMTAGKTDNKEGHEESRQSEHDQYFCQRS